MRIVSYNIRKAVGLDWKRDPARILQVLAEIDADIVVLQEADRRVGARAGVFSDAALAQQGYHIVPLAQRPLSHGWHGNAIFLRDALFPKGAPDQVATRVPIPTLEPRGAVSVRLGQFEVIGTHLALTAGMRRKQLQALHDHVTRGHFPAIVAGDFNARVAHLEPLSDVCQLIIPGPSFHTSRPRARLDRFAVFGGLRVLGSHVHHSTQAARASDHLPVVLDFEVNR
ncbi:hypothetical protein AQS8620_02437 [Aquimixticola soesokkakensis]|uniref:Endonuclease/exonuclease/phosphatase domain-containing protein n=1 Tax=Aquimixticola soesokkakensis TaxID=1519096 RepID=A0A1Y5T545_9RHOB|nr:endonuclease/exonuclease/phosphatase family protein [Aquimixticola soesokkakensis]SLN55490.1 hypothetical protein AQS8620_02437 [Aquimixticola soesokkakensis]